MLCQRMVGLIRSSFTFGSLNTSCNMPSTVGLFSCSLMGTACTLSLTQSILPKSKMWWSFAYHHIPPMNVNHWIALYLGHALKVHWRHVCHTFHQKNPNGTITKFNFTGLFKQAWLKAISAENIVNGFKKSGVFPFDPTRMSALKKYNGSDHGDDSRHNSGSSDNESSDNDHNGDPSGESHLSNNNEPSDDELLSECNVVDKGLDSAFVFTQDDLLCNENFNQCESTEEASFSAEEEALYQRRFEEGYDVFGSRYLTWLE